MLQIPFTEYSVKRKQHGPALQPPISFSSRGSRGVLLSDAYIDSLVDLDDPDAPVLPPTVGVKVTYPIMVRVEVSYLFCTKGDITRSDKGISCRFQKAEVRDTPKERFIGSKYASKGCETNCGSHV